jgi:thymidylate synthase (FAD)
MKLNVLDHGFVILRNVSGPTRRVDRDLDDPQYGIQPRPFDADDVDPANSARMSFDQMDSGRTREMDLKLCDYLIRNWHTSPFEMIEVWLEMKLPIFVARQFVRHRTVSINEVSGRYIQLPSEWFIPAVVGGKAPNKKQGQSDNLDVETQAWFKRKLLDHNNAGYALYEEAIERGVAMEHARMALQLNHYTHWLWKQDLHNLMHFMSLRDHAHAQVEAQVYAHAISVLLRDALPECMALYDKYRRRA